MATSLITGANAAPSINGSVGKQTATTNPDTQAGATNTQKDTVKLSPGAQALQLYEQGNSIQFIAATLGVSVATVDSYLPIQAPTAATADPLSASSAAASVKS